MRKSGEKFLDFLKNRKVGHKKDKISNDLFINYKAIVQDQGQQIPTKGGLLLFSENPQEFFSESFIICSLFKGNSGRDVISTLDCIGSLFEQFETAWNFIVSKIPTSYEKIIKKRIEKSDIPLVAIREILINAIVHRDYRILAPIKIAIYQNRIEIFSPGGFPGPIDTDQIGNGVTYIRNQMITKCFREAGYIEKLGSGFKIMLDAYKQEGLITPTVYEGDGFVKVILPSEKMSTRSNSLDPKNDILQIFDIFEKVSISDITLHCSLSRSTVGRQLKELVESGVLKKTGRGKVTKYIKA